MGTWVDVTGVLAAASDEVLRQVLREALLAPAGEQWTHLIRPALGTPPSSPPCPAVLEQPPPASLRPGGLVWVERSALVGWALVHHRGVLVDAAISAVLHPGSTMIGRAGAPALLEAASSAGWARHGDGTAALAAALTRDVVDLLAALTRQDGRTTTASAMSPSARPVGPEVDDGSASEPEDRLTGLGCLLFDHRRSRPVMSVERAVAYLDAGFSTSEALACQSRCTSGPVTQQALEVLSALGRPEAAFALLD